MACGSTWSPPQTQRGCYEKALADAIRSANLPLLTQVYLETHTLREAAAHGIDVPAAGGGEVRMGITLLEGD